MNTFLYIILSICAFVWLCDGVSMMLCHIQDFKYSCQREDRERKQEQRDLEYHKARMKSLK